MAAVSYWLNTESYGGVIPESLLVTVAIDAEYLCGLALSFADAEAPRLSLLRRTTAADLTRMQYVPLSAERALALHPALPIFLDELLCRMASS